MKNLNPDIFRFAGYRDFLNYYLAEAKTKKRTFNVSSWAKALELGSPTSLNMVLRGQRHPGYEMREKISRYFGFDLRRRRYFEVLIELERCPPSAGKRASILSELAEINQPTEHKIVSLADFEVLSNWWHFAIREMVKLSWFSNTPALIAKSLRGRIAARQAKRAIETLLKLGYLKQTADGALHPSHPRVLTTDDIASVAIKRFHEGILEEAKIALHRDQPEAREFRASTISVKKAELPRMKERIRSFMRDFCKEFDTGARDQADEILQINTQAFFLTDGHHS